MKIKLIKSEEDYKRAISLMEEIGDNPNFEDNPDLIDEFELLEKLVDLYESENYSIEKGNPIEIIKLKMEYMGLLQKDLVEIIGSKGIVSEVMNKKRGLSKTMIRNLSEYLGLSQDILNVPYELIPADNLEACTDLQAEEISESKIKNIFGFEGDFLKSVENYSFHVRKRGMLLNVCRN